ncbi:hypothetical protein CHLRE_07g315100v5 [Chlamydomonas reinhardtii]|uniref:Thioredoxin domain-containing protein n=1 Tax=Chlamydomonas reinhardtii TaxID=3055 RepID=A0A2K3DIN0_CHLRE|nr:uncharacterized protein CHLRE_07g315100v5 [Chlamydomonas reinhardtii]PNW80380.1 hypothetical protein CHLRE_07g315100v5 [Chlamydomonas reinhardtii]
MAASVIKANVSTWSSKLAELEQAPSPHYIVFTGYDAAGAMWCPDCVRAVPAVLRAAAAAPGTLLEVDVGQRTDWRGNATHPFRTAPALKLTGIPTLLQWGGGAAVKRLGPELEACGSPAEVEALLAKSGFFQ